MRWLRPDEAAAWLRTTPQHVLVLAHRHQWQRHKSGRVVYYNPDDIERTLRDRDTPTPLPNG